DERLTRVRLHVAGDILHHSFEVELADVVDRVVDHLVDFLSDVLNLIDGLVDVSHSFVWHVRPPGNPAAQMAHQLSTAAAKPMPWLRAFRGNPWRVFRETCGAACLFQEAAWLLSPA